MGLIEQPNYASGTVFSLFTLMSRGEGCSGVGAIAPVRRHSINW